MTELADRLREATIVLRPAYAEQLSTAVAEIGELRIRARELLSFARATFPSRATDTDLEVVSETFRRRNVEADQRMRQLWSTLAGLVMINRFERGPGRRTDATIAADSLAATAIEALSSQGLASVHPDVVTRATRWNVWVAEHLRARGTVAKPGELPSELALEAVADEVETPLSDSEEEAPASGAAEPTAPSRPSGFSPEQTAVLVRHMQELIQWAAKSSTPARLEALEEQQALLWWLESGESRVKGHTNPARVVLKACEELISTTRFFPGPPATTELLKRRLGPVAAKPISAQAVAEKAAREVPSAVADICSLLKGAVRDYQREDEAIGIEVAAQLYTEMMLVELAKASIA